MTTKSWHGYYWARRTENGDYEMRTVPFTLGEHSVPGGVFPKEGFEGQFEKVSSQGQLREGACRRQLTPR